MGEDGRFRYTEAKSRSVLAQKVRDTAEARGRPVALAEKMVDKDLVVYSATNRNTGEVRYLSNKDLESLENRDEWEKGIQSVKSGNVLHCKWQTCRRAWIR